MGVLSFFSAGGLLGGGPLRDIKELALMADPLASTADALMRMSVALQGVGTAISTIDATTLNTLEEFASKSAIFSTAFSKRGLIAEHGMSWLLPRLVGMGNALDMALTARRISSEEAEKIGFVNKVFEDDVFLQEVNNYCEPLAKEVSPRSMKIMKRQMWQGLLQGLDNAVSIADEEMLKSFYSNWKLEAYHAFIKQKL